MAGRGRTLTVTILAATLVAALFLGRRLTLLLSDQWWGSLISPDASSFLLRWHLVRLTLDAVGVLVAVAWFVGHTLGVYRTLDTVQVPRYVANLEFREALTPKTLLAGTLTLGTLLGIITGLGLGDWWPQVMLAWHGVVMGEVDPLLGRDLGWYVAELPWWSTLQAFSLLLAGAALGVVALLYTMVGALRWGERRPAVSNHARGHLGVLLAALALSLAWGYWLLPYEIVAGLHGAETAGAWSSRVAISNALAGVALATAALSALWAVRPRHTLVLAAWLVLAAAWVGGRYLIPAFAAGHRPLVAPETAAHLERRAFALERLHDRDLQGPAGRGPPGRVPTAPWSPRTVERLLAVDSGTTLSVGPGTLRSPSRPVWLAVTRVEDGLSVAAIAADRISASGGALSYQADDSVAYPSVVSLAVIDSAAGLVWPGAPRYQLTSGGRGLALNSWGRRLVLAWGLQAGGLLGELPPETTLTWNNDPLARAAKLAPFARWTDLAPAWADGELWWVATGYVVSRTFPVVEPVPWGAAGTARRLVRPGFVAAVSAASGTTHIYLFPGAGPLALGWAAVAGGLVEPASAIPAALVAQLAYPRSLAVVQTRILSRPRWNAGVPVTGTGPGRRLDQAVEIGWLPTGGAGFTAVYHHPRERRISAILWGRLQDGAASLELVRLDSANSIATPALLLQRWGRFPLFEQIRDSIRRDGARLEPGRLRYYLMPPGPVAVMPYYGVRERARAVVAWYSVALGDRLGAGRNPVTARRNVTGLGVPVPPGIGPRSRLSEAQGWMRLADSSLRVGDWEGFGRAFEALREVLRKPSPP